MKNHHHSSYPIIVHCHLQWNWVWQRPQQFLSRLSERHNVLFVEGPQLQEDTVIPYYRLERVPEYPGVTIMKTYFPANRFGEGEWVDAERRRLLDEALSWPLKGQFDKPVQWFYDPMAVAAHAGRHSEILAVYDCMDELSQFKFAPPVLRQRERQLLAHAKVVFTGGRKMWESKSRYNRNAHFYGCGVDVAHFGAARKAGTPIPKDIRHLKGPILGYFGVIDERIDYDLVAQLADANPEGHVVMVGPVCKVDEASLPQRRNLHWMGGRPYGDLPGYCKAFDVCLMPFALNEATEYINPTKALEYMASGRPVVSTPVPDVLANFATVAKIGTGETFVKLCQKAVKEPDARSIEKGIALAMENRWEDIVAKMEGHIQEALDRRNAIPTAIDRTLFLAGFPLASEAA